MTPPGMPRAMAAMVATATAGNPRVPLLQLGMMIGALAGGSKTAGATGRGPSTSPPSAQASAVPAAGAPAPEVATAAAFQLVSAAVQAVLAAGAAPAAPVAASAPGVSERVRILELQLELEQLKRQRLT